MNIRRTAAAVATILTASALTLPATAPASAATASGTISFIRDGDVWLVRADGSGLHQVTTDGTVAHPYNSPTMSDGGVIAAGKGTDIVRMLQNGVVLNRIDPPPMLNSVSHPVDGVPVAVAISPNGASIAYTFTDYSCPIGASCTVRTATGVTPATGFAGPSMTSYLRNPSWVSDSRLMAHGGYGSHVKLQDAAGADQHWFDDSDVYGDADSTDLGDASLSRDGTKLVAIRGYGDSTQMIWYSVTGDPRTSAPQTLPDPGPQCIGAPGATATDPMLHDPVWSPDGSAFAIGATEGIWVVTPGEPCEVTDATLLGAGSEPSWSPAAINPPAPPAPTPATPTTPPSPTPPTPTPTTGNPGPTSPPAGTSSFTMSGRPKVKGTARVGKELRATPGMWSPTPATVRYTWLRNGTSIKGATGKTYRVTRRDKGKNISVMVKVSRAGLKTAVVTSTAKKVQTS